MAERIGANLKRLRKAAGLTQEDAAWRAQVHRTQWSLWENGEQVPRVFTLIKIAGACGATPGDVLAGIEWTPPPRLNYGGLVVSEDEG
jgi:transcriptional regulator with XRE-family HTH domain